MAWWWHALNGLTLLCFLASWRGWYLRVRDLEQRRVEMELDRNRWWRAFIGTTEGERWLDARRKAGSGPGVLRK